MDILDPEVVWVGGRCYRFFESKCWGFEGDIAEPYVEEDYQEPEELIDLQGTHDDDFLVSSYGEGKFKHSFPLPEAFYRFIIGPRGVVMRTVETETKTRIQIPSSKNSKAGKSNNKSTGAVDEVVTIIGSTRENIISCRRRIDLLVAGCRNKIRPSHFISIPLSNNPRIVEKYNEFKKQVLEDIDSKSSGIVEDLFVKELKLHLTIGVMLLLDDKEQKEAIKCLEKCVEEIVKPMLRNKEPLVFKVQGVDVFRDKKYDLKKTKVLFAKVLPNKILQDIANRIYLFLFERGIVRENSGSKNVQLHMTLIKSSRLLDNQDGYSHNLPTFDATKILQDYKQYEFGEAILDTLLISEMNSGDTYRTLTEINLLR